MSDKVTTLTKIGTWQGKDLYLHPVRDKAAIEAFAYLGHQLDEANKYIAQIEVEMTEMEEQKKDEPRIIVQ